MSSSIQSNGNVVKQNDHFYAGSYGSNGVKVTVQKVNNSGTTFKDYCPKCGQLKSNHKFLQGCPK